MRLTAISLLICFLGARPAAGHFIFVVPDADGTHAQVILSEDLTPDETVGAELVEACQLQMLAGSGSESALTMHEARGSHRVDLSGQGLRVIHGVCQAGVMSRGDAKPFLLTYYPKTILGNPFDPKATLGRQAPVEIVPAGKPGAVRFRLLAAGKPVTDAAMTIILPDGSQKKIATNGQGESPAFEAMGRYGVWARHILPQGGTHSEKDRPDKNYKEIRQYATLVVDLDKNSRTSAAMSSEFTPLPEATSSFGAVASDGWLYVYGGHIAPTHNYSTKSVSGRFHRLNLARPTHWEELPAGPGLQGMNLAAHRGKIYRAGGMQPRNQPGEEVDNHSVADCLRFDPATGKWEKMPDLPEPRSSHDIAVVGDKLYVIGGWNMKGHDDNAWLSDGLVMDLSAADPSWVRIEQPFERRALTIAACGNKLFVLGGFTAESQPQLRVDVYDPQTERWSQSADLPGPEHNGFAPAACGMRDRLHVSVGDGTLYQLDEAAGAWKKVENTTPRIVHRLVPNDPQILVIGGAARGVNLRLIEAVVPSAVSSNN